MNTRYIILLAACFTLLLDQSNSYAQTQPGINIGSKGEQEITVTTAVPFLRIAPDARAGGMGDLGIATPATDANVIFHNPAKMALAVTYEQRKDQETKIHESDIVAVSMSYVPWLRSLVNDIYLAHLSGFYKLDENQAIGGSLRFFSLGNITFTNQSGFETGQFRPNEFAFDVAYARTLVKGKEPGEGLSTGIALRFIYSNLATGQSVNGINISPGITAAGDVSFYWNKFFDVKGKRTFLALGLNLSNLGGKITYTESAERDFIPMNFGFGANYQFNIDDYNQFNLGFDINKLMVPTPTFDDLDSNGILDYREKSVPEGIFGSWGDAPNGISEELKEFTISVGAEYWYDNQFAVRAGYFYENPNKGNRQFFTAGLGLRYRLLGLDFSYLIPTTSQRNPLDNTLRFTFLLNFDTIKDGNDPAAESRILRDVHRL